MELKNFIDACNKKLTCSYCGQEITGSFAYQGWWIPTEEALKMHEKECEKNPQSNKWKLKIYISKCQETAEIYNCLNCTCFQKQCEWTKNIKK